MLGLATALLLLLPEVVMPRPTELSSAAAAGDTVELERLATRLGPMRLVGMLEEPSRKQSRLTLAALRGLGLMGASHPDLGVQILPSLVETLGRLGRARLLDDKQLAAASDALHRTSAAVGHYAACSDNDVLDCPPVLSEAADRLLDLASDAGMPMALREGALESLAALPPPAWQRLVPRLLKLATLPAPTPKPAPVPTRAAMTVLAALVPRDAGEPLFQLVRSAEPSLASDAAGELCTVATPVKTKGRPAPPLADDLATRIRALAGPDQPLAQRQRLVECLRLLGTASDKALAAGIVSAAKKGHK